MRPHLQVQGTEDEHWGTVSATRAGREEGGKVQRVREPPEILVLLTSPAWSSLEALGASTSLFSAR